MPETTVFFYKDDDNSVPVLEWLKHLGRRDRQAFAQCVAIIRRLALLGHELRRPKADFLRGYERNPEKHTHEEVFD